MAHAKSSLGPKRPTSPHIEIYRPRVNMVMSILHRITGAALYVGTLLLAWWLLAAATGPAHFAQANALLSSPIGVIVMIGYTWTLFHHMLGGIRHLIWDTGRGFDLPTVDRLSWMTIIGSLAFTVVVWATVLRLKGVL